MVFHQNQFSNWPKADGLVLGERGTIILSKSEFLDPARPHTRSYCWHCALFEGVFDSFPALETGLNFIRMKWPKPMQKVIQLVGEEDQSLPVLLLADDVPEQSVARSINGRQFVAGKDDIFQALYSGYGIPVPQQ